MSKYYTNISIREGLNKKELSKVDIDKLLSISNKFRKPKKNKWYNNPISKNIMSHFLYRKSKYECIHADVYVDKDEWYYIVTIHISGKLYALKSTFRCDQWDGLLQCINDEILNG